MPYKVPRLSVKDEKPMDPKIEKLGSPKKCVHGKSRCNRNTVAK
jgi:hypothetical protein